MLKHHHAASNRNIRIMNIRDRMFHQWSIFYKIIVRERNAEICRH